MILTAEISVSKIFPGGFCWQAGSVVAGSLGYQATDLPLWLMTGIGDFLGVTIGHLVYMAIKKSIKTSKKTMFDEVGVGLWLGSAAFFSGTAWQPVVNLFSGLGFAFPCVALGTTAICGAAFFGGLRLGRRLYGVFGIEKAHSRNFAEDAGLSVAIGGAGGMFVGTDVTILKNPFDSFVGVYPTMTSLKGCINAGTSTVVGFSFFHTLQNTRAPASSAYVTKDTFVDIATTLALELTKSHPQNKSVVQNFLNNEVEEIFLKLDIDKDGKLTPEEVQTGLHTLSQKVSVK